MNSFCFVQLKITFFSSDFIITSRVEYHNHYDDGKWIPAASISFTHVNGENPSHWFFLQEWETGISSIDCSYYGLELLSLWVWNYFPSVLRINSKYVVRVLLLSYKYKVFTLYAETHKKFQQFLWLYHKNWRTRSYWILKLNATSVVRPSASIRQNY